jgi:hypothetical protein
MSEPEQTQRRVSAALCLAGAVLVALAVVGSYWWLKRVDIHGTPVDIKLKLTSITGCAHDPAGTWRCESIEWKEIGVPPGSGTWVWSGRLLFGVAIAAALCFALTAVIAAVPIDAHLPVSPARVGLGFAVAALFLVGLYWVSTPEAIRQLLDTGRGWWMAVAGLVLGGAGVLREMRPRD